MGYCDRCNEYYHRGLNRHILSSSRHNICNDCQIDFSTWVGLKEHWVQSPHHAYCQYCDDHFDDKSDLYDHYDDSHYWCRPCKLIFKGGELGLQQHNRQSHANRWCIPCKRLFASEANLASHQRSSIHTASDVRCPMRGCNQSFVSVSAMTLHLEQGRCVSGINRTIVNQKVVAFDRNNLITNPARLIGGSSAPPPQPMYATQRCYNGQAWECYLCPREFRSMSALNAHINSPRHQEKIYRCPKSDCRKEFSSLSGIFQHVESESCGVYQSRGVQNVLSQLSSSMGRISL